MNATLTVNSFPRITNTKNEMIDTRMGAVVQRAENMTEFTRAINIHHHHRPKNEIILSISVHSKHSRMKEGSGPQTFNHPLHLRLPRVQRPLYPPILPREELDKLDLQFPKSPNQHPLPCTLSNESLGALELCIQLLCTSILSSPQTTRPSSPETRQPPHLATTVHSSIIRSRSTKHRVDIKKEMDHSQPQSTHSTPPSSYPSPPSLPSGS